jgi:hypothetical protein
LRAARAFDLISQQEVMLSGGVRLEPYQFMWLQAQ